MVNFENNVHESAKRYAYLADLSRVFDDKCKPYPAPLLRVAMARQPLPQDAHDIRRAVRAVGHLVFTASTADVVRVFWSAYTAVESPAISKSFYHDEQPFCNRFFIRPIQTLVKVLEPEARATLMAQMQADGCDMNDVHVAHTLRSLFVPPTPRTGGSLSRYDAS